MPINVISKNKAILTFSGIVDNQTTEIEIEAHLPNSNPHPLRPYDPIPPQPHEEGYSQHIMDNLIGVFVYNNYLYCVRCRSKKLVEKAEKIMMNNGKPALKAKCPDCNTGMYKIGSA